MRHTALCWSLLSNYVFKKISFYLLDIIFIYISIINLIIILWHHNWLKNKNPILVSRNLGITKQYCLKISIQRYGISSHNEAQHLCTQHSIWDHMFCERPGGRTWRGFRGGTNLLCGLVALSVWTNHLRYLRCGDLYLYKNVSNKHYSKYEWQKQNPKTYSTMVEKLSFSKPWELAESLK